MAVASHFRSAVLDRLTDLEQRQLVLEHRLKTCPLCGIEIELCPLIAELELSAPDSPPSLIRLCELFERWGGPGHLPPRISDMLDHLLAASMGVEIHHDDSVYYSLRSGSPA